MTLWARAVRCLVLSDTMAISRTRVPADQRNLRLKSTRRSVNNDLYQCNLSFGWPATDSAQCVIMSLITEVESNLRAT